MPLQATSGAASYDGFGGGPAAVPNYIEECFATHLYTGNGSTQTITNGIDLSTKGGLVWLKDRTSALAHQLFDTARGATKALASNSSGIEDVQSTSLTSFNTTGFSLDSYFRTNGSGDNFASWTFRKQPKFFDVVTYTGDGTSNRAISHSLGSAPGCIIAKRTDAVGNWNVYHRGVSPANDNTLTLNTTSSASGGGQDIWGNGVNVTTPTTTSFYVAGQNNNNGVNYVAYIFAHDAGGFGLTGTDNVISCGSYTGNGSTTGPTITLGYEPQWVMIKNASSTGDWVMQDVMRGMPVGGNTMTLFANLSNAETDPGNSRVQPTATGFQIANTASASLNASGDTYIYIAIRRGPMKTPTTGTSVFSPYVTTSVAASASGSTLANALYSTNFVVDMCLQVNKSGTDGWYIGPRLAGNRYMKTETTAAEAPSSQLVYDSNVGAWGFNGSYGLYSFRRAPGFFDVVCYTGTGVNRTVTHNLGVAPELLIIKGRDITFGWATYAAPLGIANYVALQSTNASAADPGNVLWNNTAPTSTVFSVGTNATVNNSGNNYVAYLFASCPGVSKVFSFTGNGSSQTINCGFTGGSRLVLIKRTDSTGNWVIFDSARGIVAGNDPALYLNSTAAEVTGVDAVDTDSTGFIVNQETTFNLNVNNATYIGLAIA
jgi:hypothetical protein